MHGLIYSDTFEKDLGKLDAQQKARLEKALLKVILNPARFKPLTGFANHYRIRFGQFRLVYKVENNKIILLFIRKRDTIYRII